MLNGWRARGGLEAGDGGKEEAVGSPKKTEAGNGDWRRETGVRNVKSRKLKAGRRSIGRRGFKSRKSFEETRLCSTIFASLDAV